MALGAAGIGASGVLELATLGAATPGAAALAGTSAVTAVAGVVTVSDALGNLIDVKVYKSQGSSSGGSSEGENATNNWNKGSFDSSQDSLDYHYCKHGEEVGATSHEQYLRKAEEFAKTAKKGSTKSYVDGAVEGTIRYKKNGKYIDIAPDGSIVSFGKQ